VIIGSRIDCARHFSGREWRWDATPGEQFASFGRAAVLDTLAGLNKSGDVEAA
jgi:hypothetical protein